MLEPPKKSVKGMQQMCLKGIMQVCDSECLERRYDKFTLGLVMRVITLYALESVPPQLVIPDEIKAS
ncbi:hypothetical protein H5410_062479, partial [Solanum commersonii]